jgi:hypothetical protein
VKELVLPDLLVNNMALEFIGVLKYITDRFNAAQTGEKWICMP